MGNQTTPDKKLVLVAIKGVTHKPVKEGNRMVVSGEMSKLQSDPAWKGWYFQIRTPEGYKAKPIMPKDFLTKKKTPYYPKQRHSSWEEAANSGSWFGGKHD